MSAAACIASLKSKADYLSEKPNRWPTLEGRLKHPLSSRNEAIRQMVRNGDTLTKLAEKIYRCQQAHDAEERNSKEQTVVVESERVCLK